MSPTKPTARAPGPAPAGASSTFPCSHCGAEFEFKPGTRQLACPFCGGLNDIPQLDGPIEEIDFEATLARLEEQAPSEETLSVHCDSCGADVPLDSNRTSRSCPFCGSNVVATQVSRRLIKPRSLLPFAIDRAKAGQIFRSWLGGLWFAPSELRRYAHLEDAAGTRSTGLSGIYIPCWTYDCAARTPYSGLRGDDYYVSVPTTVMVNGKPQVRIRRERRTRWTPASGEVDNTFDDVAVPGSASLAAPRFAALGSWDLKNLVPYTDQYLAGFLSESYTIGLKDGFTAARAIMEEEITRTIRQDIGGDHQRIFEMRPAYRQVTFKHILVPIWIAAYRYRDKVYRFMINARTGTVAGERPYSAAKIVLAVLAGLAAIALLVLLLARL